MATAARIGIVAGMEMERIALGPYREDPNVQVAISAADPDRAEAESERLIQDNCDVLISWGIAGGLDPDARTGMVFSAIEVLDAEGKAALLFSPSGHQMALYGSDRAITDASEKANLFARTGAFAVDMESHRVARAAHRHGIPVAAIRAIADPASRSLPTVVTNAVDQEGRARVWPVAADLLLHPWRLGTLIGLKRDTDAALDALAGPGRQLLSDVIERLDAPA